MYLYDISFKEHVYELAGQSDRSSTVKLLTQCYPTSIFLCAALMFSTMRFQHRGISLFSNSIGPTLLDSELLCIRTFVFLYMYELVPLF